MGMDSFSTYLSSCCNIMENSGELKQLNSLYEIKGLVMKLPYYFRIKFRSKIALYQDQSMNNFRLFSDFEREQAKVMKFPLFESLRDPCNAEISGNHLNKPEYHDC